MKDYIQEGLIKIMDKINANNINSIVITKTSIDDVVYRGKNNIPEMNIQFRNGTNMEHSIKTVYYPRKSLFTSGRPVYQLFFDNTHILDIKNTDKIPPTLQTKTKEFLDNGVVPKTNNAIVENIKRLIMN